MKYFALVLVGLTTACASSSGDGEVDAGAAACETIADCEDDGLYCNGDVICRDGTCQDTAPPNCADGISCTVDSCDETLLGCVNVPNDTLCDEGLACLEGEGCGTPPACEFTGDCQDDEFLCNGAPECEDGACISTPLDCVDTDDCTADSCVEGTGCVNDPYDFMNDVDHCTAACTPCPGPTLAQENVERVCDAGVCGFVCLAGYWDVNDDMSDGCEVACATDPDTTVDVPDDSFQDQNCDGIDGTVADGIFVAEDGSNANPGTMAFPVKNIGTGISKAMAAGKEFVYISAGNYNETVTIDATNQGIGLHGGYLRASGWARDGTRGVITGPRTGALRVNSVTLPTIVEYLRFEGATATTASKSSHGIVVTNSSGFYPRYLIAHAGHGANGVQGSNQGAMGDDGGDGTPGTPGFEDDGGVGCAGNSTNPDTNYAGGDTCTGSLVSTKGGDGRRGCLSTDSNCAGLDGLAGNPNPAGTPSDQGFGVSDGTGGFGQRGADGGSGTDPAGGSGGSISSNEWVPNGGGDGGRGGDGTGGGGGAGGGSSHCWGCCYDWGGSGGGGGGGGCGGTGGNGGTGGGGSIAILLVNSTVIAEYVEVITHDGGDGGAGRSGGSGGPGGDGKSGGGGNDESAGGGSGGDGGNGGRGGHGAGGAGGWTVHVYESSSTWSDGGTTTFTANGSPGGGGTSPGNDGANGQSWTIYPAP